MTNPTNNAAYLLERLSPNLTIRPSPYPLPGPGQLVIRNAAVAINPIDVALQDTDFVHLKYPVILGDDVAGEVVAIGEGVQGFQNGMRVLSHPKGWPTGDNAQGGYQEYTLVPATVTAPLPNDLSFEKAVVLPLAICTAAAGLYQKDSLALDLPTLDTAPGSKGEVIVVWGGSSSVGGTAIQLLKYSGYDIFATASAHNLSYVESLGAAKVFDYNTKDVVDSILAALEGKTLVGKTLVGCYDAISTPSTLACMKRIAERSQGKKMVTSTNPTLEVLDGVDVQIKGVFAGAVADNEIGPAIFHDFLPEALVRGMIFPKPDPIVVGAGLDEIQEGINRLRKGVSAGKYVVLL